MQKIIHLRTLSLSTILKFFLNFGQFEPHDSYKLYSYKKKWCSKSLDRGEFCFRRQKLNVSDQKLQNSLKIIFITT